MTQRTPRAKALNTLSCLIAMGVSMSGCEGWGLGLGAGSDNTAPFPVGGVFQVVTWLHDGRRHVAMSPYFRDDDGDSLTFGAEVDAPDVLRVSTWDGFVDVEPLRHGQANVTVTATDPEGLTATHMFEVRVLYTTSPLLPLYPSPANVIPTTQVRLGHDAQIRLSEHFTAPTSMTFTAASSQPEALRATVSGATLELEGRDLGWARVSVTATNLYGTGEQTADVFVAPQTAPPNQAPKLLVDPVTKILRRGVQVRHDVSEYFSDSDDVRLEAKSDKPEWVTVAVSGTHLLLEGKVRGRRAQITITATDAGGLFTRAAVEVQVN